MRCSTCGETLAGSEAQCPTCGAAVLRVPVRTEGLPQCPRCGYAGQGVPYFRRPGHMGLLVGLGLVSYGIGSLVYWLMRRDSVVCPNCGLRWDWVGASRQIAPPRGAVAYPGIQPVVAEEPLPRSGSVRRVLGALGAMLGVLLITVGISEFAAPPVIAGAFFGAMGGGTFLWGYSALQARRKALVTALQRRVLRLATERGGTLTVTEVATDLNLTLPAAEKVLEDLDDGFRVRSEVTDEGVILYDFPEVRHRHRLEPGSSA